jgi:hypothetical protein
MFGQLVVSKTNVLPAFYALFLQAVCNLSPTFSASRAFIRSCLLKGGMQRQFSKILLASPGNIAPYKNRNTSAAFLNT